VCSCVCLVLIVFCDISADAEPEEIQVLVGFQSFPPPPGMCTGSVSVLFYCWADTGGSKLSHVNSPATPSLTATAALRTEGEQGVVASPLPLSMCEGEGKFFLPIFLSCFAWLLYWRNVILSLHF